MPSLELRWLRPSRASSITLTTRTCVFVRKMGKNELVNPRRYGTMTVHDYARFRLSIFAREEAPANVTYLQYKREGGP